MDFCRSVVVKMDTLSILSTSNATYLAHLFNTMTPTSFHARIVLKTLTAAPS
jgi:hypothetical protein